MKTTEKEFAGIFIHLCLSVLFRNIESCSPLYILEKIEHNNDPVLCYKMLDSGKRGLVDDWINRWGLTELKERMFDDHQNASAAEYQSKWCL